MPFFLFEEIEVVLLPANGSIGKHMRSEESTCQYSGVGCYYESALGFKVRIMEGSDMDEKKMEFDFDERTNRLYGGRL